MGPAAERILLVLSDNSLSTSNCKINVKYIYPISNDIHILLNVEDKERHYEIVSIISLLINYYFNLHIVYLFVFSSVLNAYLSLVDEQQVNSVPFVASS